MFSRIAKRAASKSWLGPSVLGGLYAGGAAAGYAVFAEDKIHPPHNHWPFSGVMDAYDTAALRRGYEVYRQVCSTCHSMTLIHYRDLIGASHTEEQAKALANAYEVQDGPNAEGEMFDRKAKLSDHFNSPYPNDEAARAANAGALPPDLSCISKARHSGPDYIFALLTGYGTEPPAGLKGSPGLHYNPYFPGQFVAMAEPLMDEQVEYEDGTPATKSQMAKDVVSFLQFCSEKEQDERRKAGMRYGISLVGMIFIAGYYKRFAWASTKTRRISWID